MNMHIPNERLYAPQTKILGRPNEPSGTFLEALFKGVSTIFGIRNVEKFFEKDVPDGSFGLPKIFVWGAYNWEERTSMAECVFEALFKCVSSCGDPNMGVLTLGLTTHQIV
jgi:hypothetical protein